MVRSPVLGRAVSAHGCNLVHLPRVRSSKHRGSIFDLLAGSKHLRRGSAFSHLEPGPAAVANGWRLEALGGHSGNAYRWAPGSGAPCGVDEIPQLLVVEPMFVERYSSGHQHVAKQCPVARDVLRAHPACHGEALGASTVHQLDLLHRWRLAGGLTACGGCETQRTLTWQGWDPRPGT